MPHGGDSTFKFGKALVLLGAWAFCAGVLAMLLLRTSGPLWLSAVGAGLYLLGMAVMLPGLFIDD